MKDFKGIIIAESLIDPTVINSFTVFGAEITRADKAIDYEGNIGRWHLYSVMCSREEINELQPHILHGWYAHFWKGDKIIVVYNDMQFEVDKNDKKTWKEAIEHGRNQGIPANELDFVTY